MIKVATPTLEQRLTAARKLPRDRSVYEQCIIDTRREEFPELMQADCASRKRQRVLEEQEEMASALV